VQDIRTQQERYMPALLRADHEMDISGSPERSRCFLPSELDDTHRAECCSKELVTAEICLRTAAAYEALEDVCRHIRMPLFSLLEFLNTRGLSQPVHYAHKFGESRAPPTDYSTTKNKMENAIYICSQAKAQPLKQGFAIVNARRNTSPEWMLALLRVFTEQNRVNCKF
jgi:hypothetical protein